MQSDSIVIIPTYNEIENVGLIISAVFELKKSFDILVVDDNSPDGTAEKVRELQAQYPNRLHLEVRREKSGLGTAYIHGFRWALDRPYEFIFEMDADFSHNPRDLIRLYNAALNQNADLIVGSRYINGVNVVNWPLRRVLLSYGASVYVKLITGMRVQDPTAGFVCYSRKVIASLNLDAVEFVGYAFQIEMKFKAHLKNFNIVEVPIIFQDRTRGKSKMNGKIINEAIFGVLKLKWRSLWNKKYF
ncbi:polyprenol monophosphomannose synthase [Galbibacter sp.]|jgi:dolichol-phosphate mannosyltransferase|uniref:polyprenol monophosphomannose synthase n=1 Tax=Galbibacter sp. TaxID=2918471 RepID=UPI003A90B2DE